MTEVLVCPNELRAKTVLVVAEDLRDKVIPFYDDIVVAAATMNKAATEDPLVTLNTQLSTEQVNEIAVEYTNDRQRLTDVVDRASSVIDEPCPGLQTCAKACVKKVVAFEAMGLIQEITEKLDQQQV